jgi:hypothetical protein
MAGNLNGFTIGYTVVGVILLYSGIQGSSISSTFQSLISGSATVTDSETINTSSVEQSEAASAAASPAPAGNTGAATASAAANQAIAKVLAAPYGWSTGTQWTDLVSLWNQESGWNNTAQNPSSTAYGIAQFLDTTWATVGATKTSNATAQISAGLKYIKQRYGSPSAAWANEVSEGYY